MAITTKLVSCEEWLRMPVVEDAFEEVVNGEIRIMPLSPANSRRERSEKLSDYESLGVPEVWVISPEAMTVEVLLLKEGKLSTAATLREGLLHPTQFPETAINIASIWPE